jgi:hypothetical protein
MSQRVRWAARHRYANAIRRRPVRISSHVAIVTLSRFQARPLAKAALAVPAALAAYHKAKIEKWWPTIKAVSIMAQ